MLAVHMPHAAPQVQTGMTPHDSPVASPAPLQANFPVADATVLSSGGRARTAAAANVGTLAGEPIQSLLHQHLASIWLELLDKLASSACQLVACVACLPTRLILHLPSRPTPAGVIRQQKNNALAPDVAALPVIQRADKPAPASVLARTTSGNVISAPTER